MRLRQCGLRSPLPGTLLSIAPSLANKMDELQLLLGTQRLLLIFRFVLHGDVAEWIDPRLGAAAGRFQLFRADRHTGLFSKTNGGGICFYMNICWCTDVTVILQHCPPVLESFIDICKPFYSPREFAVVLGDFIKGQTIC